MRNIATGAAVLALALAGCGGGDEGDSGSSGGATSTPAADTAGGGANAVEIKGFAYGPADMTVKVGDTVTWTNQDSAVHDVVADDGTFESGDLGQGDTFEYTADKAGTFSYVCTYHAQMKATLTVR